MNENDWMAKALENLTAAEICLERDLHNASVNRAYYAMYQAAIAVLIKHGVGGDRQKWGHDYVQAQFTEALIRRRKIFPSNFRGSLKNAMEKREVADYRVTQISGKIASRTLRLAQNFVEQIKEVLEK